MVKLNLFIIFCLFHFETIAQIPENYIPTQDEAPITNTSAQLSAVSSNQQIDSAVESTNTMNLQSVPSTNQPSSENQSTESELQNGQVIEQVSSVTENMKTETSRTIDVKEPNLKRTIAVAPDSGTTKICPEFIEQLDACTKEKCSGDGCQIHECKFSKVLNQELHTFTIGFQKNSKNGKCNLKHELKNSKELPIESYNCQFNSLQMRQAKVYYSRFVDIKEFSLEKPICIEPTADGGRKIASTCEISFDDGLKLINIFDLGKKFNQCQ
jgi:hypothetical protein